MEGFYRQKEAKRVDYFRQGHFPLWNGRGFYQTAYFIISPGNYSGWFKIPLLGEAESAIRLVIKLWFGDVT